MIYPNTFEKKIGFDEIRSLLHHRCQSRQGREKVDAMTISTDADTINTWLNQVSEYKRMLSSGDMPSWSFADVREAVARLRLDGTYMVETELCDLRRTLSAIATIVKFLNRTDDTGTSYPYPALRRLTEGVTPVPALEARINATIDIHGHVKDNASTTLYDLRRELSRTEASISHTLASILRSAQSEGLVEKDAAPTLRDGRLVIPVSPSLKRKIRGIVHDSSATGRTVYVEPAEVVEANNRIREIEADIAREIVRLLIDVARSIRPHVPSILDACDMLATLDMISAKTALAIEMNAIEPHVDNAPALDWHTAVHPLLHMALVRQNKAAVALDISLTDKARMLIISGPNAGGKSVCLKTVGLLQYMLQCGLSIPIGEGSHTGVFSNIMVDIGDEQSITDDLSTYSGHLANMKSMLRHADNRTLLLIDEFGSGTEPQIGGAIAEAVLSRLCDKHAYGVVTTHYRNLKLFASRHDGVCNGAMLYDRNRMTPLFQLAIGHPGSSFAIDIARNIGLPSSVIDDAISIVGTDYIDSDKYLLDIARDRRYWADKRRDIHRREKELQRQAENYAASLNEIESRRKNIINEARQQAERLLQEANRRIENTIREIKESNAERDRTRQSRQRLAEFRENIDNNMPTPVELREAKKTERKRSRAMRHGNPTPSSTANTTKLSVGDTVRIIGTTTIATIEKLDEKTATIVRGNMRTRLAHTLIERADDPRPTAPTTTSITRVTIEDRNQTFHTELDIRGMRADEAMSAVASFVDDAIMVGATTVRILHGKGNGILRAIVRQYLDTVDAVQSYADEHVEFGGAGITVIKL